MTTKPLKKGATYDDLVHKLGRSPQGVDRIEHLRASHCKPWRDSSDSERLDGENRRTSKLIDSVNFDGREEADARVAFVTWRA